MEVKVTPTPLLSIPRKVARAIGSVMANYRSWHIAVSVVLLGACVPVPFSGQSYIYSLDVTVQGRHYLLQRTVTCSREFDLDESDGGWKPQWGYSQSEPSAADVGDDLVILLNTKMGCHEQQPLIEHNRVIWALRHSQDPQMLYEIRGRSEELSITVNREWTTRASFFESLKLRTKSSSLPDFDFNSTFIRMEANASPNHMNEMPREQQDYFLQLDRVTPAPSKLLVPGRPDLIEKLALFPGSPRNRSGHQQLRFDGRTFSLDPEALNTDGTVFWYPIKRLPDGYYPLVTYKDVVFPVFETRDMFDPEIGEIYEFNVERISLVDTHGRN
jgi:hypothetical protein